MRFLCTFLEFMQIFAFPSSILFVQNLKIHLKKKEVDGSTVIQKVCVIEKQCCDVRRAGVNGSRCSSPLWTSCSHMCSYRYYSSHKTTRPHLKVVSCRNTKGWGCSRSRIPLGSGIAAEWAFVSLDALAPSKATSRCGSTARIKCLNHYLSRGILGLKQSCVLREALGLVFEI